ncbi:hypothetical protein V6N13_024614 [Hibiscus sabdariffa]
MVYGGVELMKLRVGSLIKWWGVVKDHGTRRRWRAWQLLGAEVTGARGCRLGRLVQGWQGHQLWAPGCMLRRRVVGSDLVDLHRAEMDYNHHALEVLLMVEKRRHTFYCVGMKRYLSLLIMLEFKRSLNGVPLSCRRSIERFSLLPKG